jgi:aspartate kinase
MALIVQKFGGTSVGSIERIKNVAQLVKAERDIGNQVVVVVSAMSGVTDQLVGLVSQLSTTANDNERQEYDSVVSTGENVSSGLVALALMNLGFKARSWQGWQIPIITNELFSQGKIQGIDPTKILQCLQDNEIPVISGFQGVYDGRIVTLGRGGSDTSAAAIAAAINADRCDIYTDVDGVYTADPRVVPAAQKLDKITYGEMLEMAASGAKVLHPRSVEIAEKYNLQMQVLSSMTGGKGTLLVNENDSMESQRITGVSGTKKICCFTIESTKNNLKIFSELHKTNVHLDLINQNLSDNSLMIIVPAHEQIPTENILGKICEYKLNENIAKVSITGIGMQASAGVVQKVFHILAEQGINVLMITTTDIKISILVESQYMEKAMKNLHSAFGLDALKEAL